MEARILQLSSRLQRAVPLGKMAASEGGHYMALYPVEVPPSQTLFPPPVYQSYALNISFPLPLFYGEQLGPNGNLMVCCHHMYFVPSTSTMPSPLEVTMATSLCIAWYIFSCLFNIHFDCSDIPF